MNAQKLLVLLLFITWLSVCKKEEVQSLEGGDYLIFGHYFGECFGETCMETYKLTSTRLYEDIIDGYGGNGPFDFKELSHQEFEQVKDLIDYFPAELLSSTETTFGCPDCADGGGLFIEYSQDGEANAWRIDQQKDQVPAYLHAFMDEVNEKILLIE